MVMAVSVQSLQVHCGTVTVNMFPVLAGVVDGGEMGRGRGRGLEKGEN